jgi:hypothetical protein
VVGKGDGCAQHLFDSLSGKLREIFNVQPPDEL